jgi:phosphate transport system permease protein
MYRLGSFRMATTALSAVIPLVLLAILAFLALYSWPAIRFNGLGFLVTKTWSLGNLYASPVITRGVQAPRGAEYGILVFMVGTLLSSFLALLVAVPVALGVAIFLTDGAPPRLRPALSLIVEMLAVVPSVVYGLWGVAVLVPLVGSVIAPAISAVLGFIPFFRATVGSGFGLLACALVLALMVVPIIAATVHDALRRVPQTLREAAFAMGATQFEVIALAVLPMVRTTIIGAVILGLGRALGETMAVLMVSGGALNYLPNSLVSPISTMAAFIASQLDSALTDPTELAVRSLAQIALVLFIIAVIVNVIARLITRSAARAGAN